jgi:hypothetical protein
VSFARGWQDTVTFGGRVAPCLQRHQLIFAHSLIDGAAVRCPLSFEVVFLSLKVKLLRVHALQRRDGLASIRVVAKLGVLIGIGIGAHEANIVVVVSVMILLDLGEKVLPFHLGGVQHLDV